MGDTRWHDIICRQENYTQLGWQECKPVAHLLKKVGGVVIDKASGWGRGPSLDEVGEGTAASTQPGGGVVIS